MFASPPAVPARPEGPTFFRFTPSSPGLTTRFPPVCGLNQRFGRLISVQKVNKKNIFLSSSIFSKKAGLYSWR